MIEKNILFLCLAQIHKSLFLLCHVNQNLGYNIMQYYELPPPPTLSITPIEF